MRSHAYRRVLGTRHVPRALSASIVGRLPGGMTGIALVLLVRDAGGSYGDAGLVTGAVAIANAVAAPVLGRLVDRRGQTRVLLTAGLVNAAAFTVLALAAGRLGTAGMAAVAAVAGAATPPLAPCMRALWGELLDGEHALHAAFALESTVQELIWIVGPLVAVGLAAAVSPTAAVLSVGVAVVAGTVWFAGSPASRSWRGSGRVAGGRLSGPLTSPGLRAVLGALTLVAIGFGVAEVAMPAFGEELGSRSAAGGLFAVWGFGSAVGGFAYGARTWNGDPGRRFTVLVALLAASFAPLAVAGGWVPMALVLLVSGATIAPTIACGYLLIDRSTPAGTVTEAFTWAATAFMSGAAIGNAAGGLAVDAGGATGGFLAGFAAVVGAAAVAATFRARLGARPVAVAPAALAA